MRVPPPVTGDLRQWAQAVTRSLQAGQGQLASLQTESSAAEDGTILWDRSALAPVVSRGGVWVPVGTVDAAGRLDGDYTLTSTTAAQKLFDWSANGALTLQAGAYQFGGLVYLESMSATSGNAQFTLGGTATLTGILFRVFGVDDTNPATPFAVTGSAAVTASTGASAVVAATGTRLVADIAGGFRVTVAGTVIPQIALVTAATPAVKAGSHMWFKRLSGASETAGEWT